MVSFLILRTNVREGKTKMDKKKEYLIIDSSALPDVYIKVVEVKKMLATGEAKTILDAVDKAGISRSAFYKYKDFVFPFSERTKDRVLTFSFMINDKVGTLSLLLSCLAESGCNIVTINQNIPSNGMSLVTISFETAEMQCGLDALVARLETIKGVKSVTVAGTEI